MKKISLILIAAVAFFQIRARAQADLPVDKNATGETFNIYGNLKKIIDMGIMSGHQDNPGSAGDFKKFYASEKTLFQKEVTKEGLYR